MVIRRDIYLNKLISKRHNGLIKVVTGVRRCGKSYLLFELFREYLKNEQVPDDHIIGKTTNEGKKNMGEILVYIARE
jgi:predicted AAA+ superfamily ATPase